MTGKPKDNVKLHISDNNKKLLERVLEAIFDAMPYSDNPNTAMLEHNGVLGDFTDYERALFLLKKLGVIEEFQNTRYGKPVDNGTVHVYDVFEVTFDREKVSEFSKTLSGNTLGSKPSPEQTPPGHVKVERKSYDTANGILLINGKQVQIIKQQNEKGVQHESKQARLMRLIFNDVKGDFGVAPMRSVLSVRTADFRPQHRKLVKSYVSEINKKIHQETSVKDFLLTNQHTVMINELYL